MKEQKPGGLLAQRAGMSFCWNRFIREVIARLSYSVEPTNLTRKHGVQHSSSIIQLSVRWLVPIKKFIRANNVI